MKNSLTINETIWSAAMTPETTKIVSLLIFILAAILLTGCNTVELQSQWTEPIPMGNSDTDEPHNASYFDEDSRLRVSIMNNDDTLYIQLVTRSQATKMLFLRAGFTVWIDTSGEAIKNFGILFPVARQNKTWGNVPDHSPRNSMEVMVQDSQYNLAILNGLTNSRQTIPTTKAADRGIYTRLRLKHDYLIYELQIPLSHSEDSDSISIGFESGAMEMVAGKGASGGNRSGKGRGGGGKGGKGKMKGGNGSSHGGSRPEPIEIWAQVHLAAKPTKQNPAPYQ
jgi:uncharacterized membrane protein YgcG